MDPVEALRQENKMLKRQVAGMMRVAQVVEVDPETSRLVCESEGLHQSDVPFFTFRAGEDQTYWLPSPGELGLLLSPSGNSAHAIFLGGIFYSGYPALAADTTQSKRIFRGENGVVETVETEDPRWTMEAGESSRVVDTEKVEDKHTDANRIKIDEDETLVERGGGSLVKIAQAETVVERATGNVMLKVGANLIDMNAVAVSILGALIFPGGQTGFVTGMGPVMYSPGGGAPGSVPPPPAGSNPNSDNEVTTIPAEDVDRVVVKMSSNLGFVVPALPVNTAVTVGALAGVGVGQTTPTPVDVAVSGTIDIQIPAKDL